VKTLTDTVGECQVFRTICWLLRRPIALILSRRDSWLNIGLYLVTDRSRGAEYTKHTIQTDRPIDVVELRAAGNESYPITQCSANRSETKNWTILMKAVPQPHTRLTATDAVDVVTAAAAARDARPWTPGALQTQRSCGFILPMAAVGLLAACACWRESRRSALAIANSWHNALCLRSGNSGSSQSTMYLISSHQQVLQFTISCRSYRNPKPSVNLSNHRLIRKAVS